MYLVVGLVNLVTDQINIIVIITGKLLFNFCEDNTPFTTGTFCLTTYCLT
jgi:hypothetical protein